MEISTKVFALDLKKDPKLIAEYLRHHNDVWPEILETFSSLGIVDMKIYHVFNRLVMIIEVNSDYDGSNENLSKKQIEVTEKWEKLMWNYQKRIPGSRKGQKWVEMQSIFNYSHSSNDKSR